ncbi:hypothetical protein FEE95_01200 [Maribacter algarum]|uniref:TfoX N-terminal domain-containing protein n=1 Tax=Maribacter algarum (ex Zhang et al. 2020) TaxID=2578118 RepID=A0A5S3PV53_9FLAO|nr:hypothetical protein [Maribacter algarum]TMM58072.1 hypothetical protein FEE95_01200 [Maribacter algarum]
MDTEKLKIYDALIAKCDRFERKGKTMPYTSANGYMFSLFNKANEIGIRFSKETQKKYIAELGTTIYKSYGAMMKGYILIPESMWADEETLLKLLNESFDYVMSLPPK